MLEAASSGDVKTAQALLESDASLANASGEYHKTPLHWAAERDDLEMAALLLDAGADIDSVTSWGASPLEWAGYLGSTRVADLLLQRGASGLNLVLAAGLGRLDDVRALCESNESLADLGIPKRPNDANDEKGWPPDAARMTGDVLGEAFQVGGLDRVVVIKESRPVIHVIDGDEEDIIGFLGAKSEGGGEED